MINAKFETGDDKEERKAQKAEEKRIAKENRKSTGASAATTTEPLEEKDGATESPIATPAIVEPAEEETSQTIADRREVSSTPTHIRTSMEDQSSLRIQEVADAANPDLSTPLSPNSGSEGGKVKNWLKTKFRRSSKAQKPTTTNEKESFVGGAALTGASANNSTVSLGARSSSARDVALASTGIDERGRVLTRESEPVSPITAAGGEEEDEEFQEARDNFDEDLAPPPTFSTGKESSPARAAKFTEEI